MGLLEKSNHSWWKFGAVALGTLSAAIMWRASRTRGEPVDRRTSSNGSKRLATTHFNAERHTRNRRAMRVLMGWSLLNMATGTRGYLKSEGSRRCFHEMNAGFGVASAVGAAVSFLRLRRELGSDPTDQGIRRANGLEKLLLADAGFSLACLGGGAYLAERGRRTESDKLRGYGPSMMVQGGFFLLFDTTLFVLINRHRRDFERKVAPIERIRSQESETRV